MRKQIYKDAMTKSHGLELAPLNKRVTSLLKQAVLYLDVLKIKEVKEEEVEARVSTVVAAASHFKLDSKTAEPGSTPIPLANVIVDMRQELKDLEFEKDSNQASIEKELARLRKNYQEAIEEYDKVMEEANCATKDGAL